MRRKGSRYMAFTLIELVTVISIISLLSVVIFPMIAGALSMLTDRESASSYVTRSFLVTEYLRKSLDLANVESVVTSHQGNCLTFSLNNPALYQEKSFCVFDNQLRVYSGDLVEPGRGDFELLEESIRGDESAFVLEKVPGGLAKRLTLSLVLIQGDMKIEDEIHLLP